MNTATSDNNKPYVVAIVAMGPSHREYLDACLAKSSRFAVADETWAINAMAGVIDNDLAVIMDDLRYFTKAARNAPHLAGYADWLAKHPRIVTSVSYLEFPGSMDYPLSDVVADLGYAYFNNTVAYAIALAIHLKVKEIKIYGCDFTYANNRGFAEAGRACVEYWLAVACHRGIKVSIASTSTLCDQSTGRQLYGYSVQPTL